MPGLLLVYLLDDSPASWDGVSCLMRYQFAIVWVPQETLGDGLSTHSLFKMPLYLLLQFHAVVVRAGAHLVTSNRELECIAALVEWCGIAVLCPGAAASSISPSTSGALSTGCCPWTLLSRNISFLLYICPGASSLINTLSLERIARHCLGPKDYVSLASNKSNLPLAKLKIMCLGSLFLL